MADQNNSSTGGAQAGVAFTPAEPLKEETGGTTTFEPAPDLADAAESSGKRSTTQVLKEEAGKLTQQAAERARAFAGDGKARASGALDEFARMLSDAAETVDEKLGSQYGQYARSAADTVGELAETLRSKEVDDLLEDVRDFVRKSPAVAIGTAAALGFVLARVVKAGIDSAADAADRESRA